MDSSGDGAGDRSGQWIPGQPLKPHVMPPTLTSNRMARAAARRKRLSASGPTGRACPAAASRCGCGGSTWPAGWWTRLRRTARCSGSPPRASAPGAFSTSPPATRSGCDPGKPREAARVLNSSGPLPLVRQWERLSAKPTIHHALVGIHPLLCRRFRRHAALDIRSNRILVLVGPGECLGQLGGR